MERAGETFVVRVRERAIEGEANEACARALAEYFGVSEDKLMQLPPEKYLMLRDNGALGQIYDHLLSLGNGDELPRLIGVNVPAGPITLRPGTISFLAIAEAGNSACR